MLKKTFQKKMSNIVKSATNRVPDTLPKQPNSTIMKKFATGAAKKKTGLANMGKKITTMPGAIIKKQWNKNQAFRNKNSTRQKFEQNSK